MKIHPLITTTEELADLCERLAKSEFVAVDTEFMRENTYYPLLCLVQVGNEEEAAARVSTNKPITEVEMSSGMRIYPNPATSTLNVELLNNAENATIRIYSSTGALVRSANILQQQRLSQISIRDLPAGLYVINVTGKNGSRSISFTKL